MTEIEYGVLCMAKELQYLVWHKQEVLKTGPKSIKTARINLGCTPLFFDKVLDAALRLKLVYVPEDGYLRLCKSKNPPHHEDGGQMKLQEFMDNNDRGSRAWTIDPAVGPDERRNIK